MGFFSTFSSLFSRNIHHSWLLRSPISQGRRRAIFESSNAPENNQKTEVSANGLHSALAQALQRLAGAATFMDRAGLLEDERIPGLIILWTLGF